MKFELLLNKLHIRNFRLFEDLQVPFHQKLTVLIGENGAGKTALLEAIAKALNVYVSAMRNNTQEFDANKYLKDNDVLFQKNDLSIAINTICNSDFTYGKRKKSADIRKEKELIEQEYKSEIYKLSQNRASMKMMGSLVKILDKDNTLPSYSNDVELAVADYETNIQLLEEEKNTKLEAIENSQEQSFPIEGHIEWKISYYKKDSKKSSFDANENIFKLNTLSFTYDENTKKGIPFLLPIVVFYNINRSVFEYKNPEKREYTALSAYDNALDGAALDYNSFFRWYKWQKDTDIFKKTNVIQHIDNAILNVLNDVDNQTFSDLIIEPTTDIREYRLVLKKENTEVEVDQLSSGEKSVLILVADIARRLCLLNPSSENPLHGQGIVLIDEIDLHLHPKWQRAIIEKLQNIFPNVQWVMTTHSPFVLQDVSKDSVLILENGQLSRPEATLGQDISTVLNQVMKVKTEANDDTLQEIFRLVALNEIAQAKEKINHFEKSKLFDGQLPKLEGAKSALKRKELLAQ